MLILIRASRKRPHLYGPHTKCGVKILRIPLFCFHRQTKCVEILFPHIDRPPKLWLLYPGPQMDNLFLLRKFCLIRKAPAFSVMVFALHHTGYHSFSTFPMDFQADIHNPLMGIPTGHQRFFTVTGRFLFLQSCRCPDAPAWKAGIVPPIHAVDDNTVMPSLVIVHIIGHGLGTGRRIFYLHDQCVFPLQIRSSVKHRTAEHPLVFPQIMAVQPHLSIMADALKKQLVCPAAVLPQKFLFQPPSLVTVLPGGLIVQANRWVRNDAGLIEGGMYTAGNICRYAVFPGHRQI